MTLTSPFFRDGDMLPAYFTCDGPNVSPALRWTMPAGGKSVALVLEDLTAAEGMRIHWVAWDIAGESLDVAHSLKHQGVR